MGGSPSLDLPLCMRISAHQLSLSLLWNQHFAHTSPYARVETLKRLGCRLMALQFTTLQKEADLRFALVRVRENCESIAFYDGHAAEASCVEARFVSVVQTLKSVIKWSSLLLVWKNAYTYATILVPSAVTAPRYFAGEIQFGVVSQVRSS